MTKNEIMIVSGEGDGPQHIEEYTGPMTARAINSRLTTEKCGGDRWAYATIETPTRHAERCSAEDIEYIMRRPNDF